MERRLYWGMFGLLLAALGGFGFSVMGSGVGDGVELPHFGFNRLVFVGVMVASIPFTVLLFVPVRLLVRAPGGRMFWIKHPTRLQEHVGPEPSAAVAGQARQRLEALGFTVEAADSGEAGARILFHKAKAENVVSFVDHAFNGELLVASEGNGTRAIATVTFADTIVVESGETERLAAFAGYLAGARPRLEVAVLPFTMTCGVVIAMTNLVLCAIPAWRPWVVPHGLSIALAAAGLILFGGYPILRKRGESYGLPLGLLGLAAAFVPLLVG